MKVLVTGGAGFIGSHIVEALLGEGVDVRVLDSLDPAVHGTAAPALDARAELLVGDVNDPDAVDAAVAGVDAVCHQAAKVGLGVDFGDVGSYVANNDAGTASLLAGLWRRGFRGRLVLAGSMVVYGDGQARCPVHGLVSPA
ncbi:MAG TPA: SDR family NAD(P)-dependent oxidoreductase, partial [Acidimicrobiales bacterium]